MLSIVILVCAATVDHSNCTAQTALMVTNGPASVAGPAGCGVEAQSMIASMLPLENGQYVKILCRRGGGKVEAQLSPDGPNRP